MRPRIAEAVVVEGRYDRDTLLQAVDCIVVETDGFGVFNDGEKLELIRRLAKERGVILLTDSDGAGFVIRGHLRGKLSQGEIKHAYIPDVAGKERRKKAAGRDGLLGVEGMSPQVIVDALRSAGATFLDEEQSAAARAAEITRADCIAAGLSGAPDSAEKRAKLIKMLGLPSRISPSQLYRLLSIMFTKERFFEVVNSL